MTIDAIDGTTRRAYRCRYPTCTMRSTSKADAEMCYAKHEMAELYFKRPLSSSLGYLHNPPKVKPKKRQAFLRGENIPERKL